MLMFLVVFIPNFDIPYCPYDICIATSAVEACIMYYALQRMIRSAVFITLCTILGMIVYAGHIRELDELAKKLIRKFKRLNLFPISNRIIFQNHLEQHNRICYLVVTGSSQLF